MEIAIGDFIGRPLVLRLCGCNMEDKLHKMIDDFLSVRRESYGGGWAQIEQEDVAKLGNIIRELIEAKCESDSDGSYPIYWELLNRRVYETPSWLFPIRHNDGTNECLEENIDAAFSNLESVMNRLNSLLKIRAYCKSERDKSKQ